MITHKKFYRLSHLKDQHVFYKQINGKLYSWFALCEPEHSDKIEDELWLMAFEEFKRIKKRGNI